MQNQELKNQAILQLPPSERPYEKCLQQGAETLSDRELLAIILRCGRKGASSLEVAGQVLGLTHDTPYPGLAGLCHLSAGELMQVEGIGKVKAIQLQCIGELSKRIAGAKARKSLQLTSARSVFQYLQESFRHEEVEHVKALMLDSKNQLLAERELTKGTVNMSLISSREVFLEALRCHAVMIILVHNHPSGDPTPSPCDIEATNQIYRAGKMVGIALLDHIIVGDSAYFSFQEHGMIENT